METITREKDYKIDEVHLSGGAGGKWSARVTFVVTNKATGERLSGGDGVVVMDYAEESYNTFWENFNSGTFLYEELKKRLAIDATVDLTVEAEFTNVVVEPTVEPTVEAEFTNVVVDPVVVEPV